MNLHKLLAAILFIMLPLATMARDTEVPHGHFHGHGGGGHHSFHMHYHYQPHYYSHPFQFGDCEKDTTAVYANTLNILRVAGVAGNVVFLSQ